ncbi:MAG: gliding motility lipoprotein GldD [Flavobacteriales bacterium]|jgi:gliding motility-associated lipoprotein GldD|nr:gliding motility lipoprotein GldD [Flavobacteriales bacterium]
MKFKFLSGIIVFSVLFMTTSCEEEDNYYPKPRGFLRMDFPEREFVTFDEGCPFSFEVPKYFTVEKKDSNCNADIYIERFNASMFLTYIPVDTNLMMNIEYSRKLVYDHSIKADAIEELVIADSDHRRYGLKYNIKGDAASLYQFYLTDSTDHFLRGALYFNSAPNYDSLKPSLDYVVEDIDHLIETVRWKEDSSNNEPN